MDKLDTTKLETRSICCQFCGIEIGQCSFPVGTSESQWDNALQGYACERDSLNTTSIDSITSQIKELKEAIITLEDQADSLGISAKVEPIDINPLPVEDIIP